MNYEEAIKEMARRRLVQRIWGKVNSGFYPEIDEELKLHNIERQIATGEYKEGFWNLIKFLITDLVAMTESDLSAETKELADIIGRLTDQKEVQRHLDEIKPGIEGKAVAALASLQTHFPVP